MQTATENQLEHLLSLAIQKLETGALEISKQQEYTRETEKLRMLVELAKEQIKVKIKGHAEGQPK